MQIQPTGNTHVLHFGKMAPQVDAAIIRSNAAKDSSSPRPKPKSLEDPAALVRKGEKINLDPKFVSSHQDGDNHHTPQGALSDQLVKRSEHLGDPHGMILRRLHFELDRIDKGDADQQWEEEEEEEEEESRSVLVSEDESLLESVLSEIGVVCAQADELLIGFSAVSIGGDAAAAAEDEDELFPAPDLLLITDDDDEFCPPAVVDDELLLADGFETPIAMLSSPDCGIAKLCPWAPMKPGMDRRNFKNRVDSGICRKLQF